MTSPGAVAVEIDAGVAVVRIENEAKRNAMSDAMGLGMVEAFRALEGDDDVAAIVLTGAGGRAFCAGHDLSEPIREHRVFEANYFTAPALTSKPVVGAINGGAYGGGLELALNCDLRVAVDHAVFVAPGVNIGAVPVGGQCALLPHLLPPAIALEMLLRAKPLPAADAHRWGFVNELTSPEDLMPTCLEIARELATRPAVALQGIKQTVRATLAESGSTGGRAEAWFSELARAAMRGDKGAAAMIAEAQGRGRA